MLALVSIASARCFVVGDLKIITVPDGPFVAMPSRRITARCSHCRCKNYLAAKFCNQCGGPIQCDFGGAETGRPKLHSDIAHPIVQSCRDMIERTVIAAFLLEQERAKQPGYACTYGD